MLGSFEVPYSTSNTNCVHKFWLISTFNVCSANKINIIASNDREQLRKRMENDQVDARLCKKDILFISILSKSQNGTSTIDGATLRSTWMQGKFIFVFDSIHTKFSVHSFNKTFTFKSRKCKNRNIHLPIKNSLD